MPEHRAVRDRDDIAGPDLLVGDDHIERPNERAGRIIQELLATSKSCSNGPEQRERPGRVGNPVGSLGT
jgi:hypothetical protein